MILENWLWLEEIWTGEVVIIGPQEQPSDLETRSSPAVVRGLVLRYSRTRLSMDLGAVGYFMGGEIGALPWLDLTVIIFP